MIPVILFHAGFEFFGGGFVGVDVFFVISGYLITTILVEDIESNRFSIINFYERRARRILPALFFMMFVCLPFAWKLMYPGQLKDFSESLIAVNLFSSNILFYFKADGYFSAATDENPLLHTWSLAVEEQYYLLFPVFLFLAWKFAGKKVFLITFAFAAVSLILSEWAWRNYPSANFYLSPTRAWELFAGSLAAFVVHKRGVQENNFLSVFGLLAIIYSILAYSEKTPFPSLYTLVPIVGIVLLILFGGQGTLVARLLSVKYLVGIGVISYSAYLWHQPMFAFARISLSDAPSPSLMICLSIISVVLGYFSWRFVERPFRNAETIGRKVLINIFTFSFFLLTLIGSLGYFLDGNLFRWSDSIVEHEALKEKSDSYVWNKMNSFRMSTFQESKKRILVIGDSNSGDFINALMQSPISSDITISHILRPVGCGNLFLSESKYVHYVEQDLRIDCKRRNIDLQGPESKQLLHEADIVVFASSWAEWEINFLPESYQKLVSIYGEKIWFWGNKHVDFPDIDEMYNSGEVNFLTHYPFARDKFELNEKMESALQGKFINPYDLFCFSGLCRVLDNDGQLILYDGFHLSKAGARFFGKKIMEFHGDLFR